jgi:non-ribosomal peptide synthetase component E (peptide arylation enzyme)
MNLAEALARAARTYPENPAVYLGSELLYDYRTLADRTARLAGDLRSQLELQPGDHVAILMHNRPEYLETFYAIWWAGLVRFQSMPSCILKKSHTYSATRRPLPWWLTRTCEGRSCRTSLRKSAMNA